MDSSENNLATKHDLATLKEELITQYIIPKIAQFEEQISRLNSDDITLIKEKLKAIEKKVALIETVALKNQSYIEKMVSLFEILSTRFDEIINKDIFINKLNLLFEGQNKIIKLLEKMQQDNLVIRKLAESNEELDDWHWSKN